jgi:hypothetical protein
MPIEIQQRHHNDTVVNDYLTSRQVMEVVGTEIFRKMYGNIWVDATISKIYREEYDLAIILDNRFPNEVNSVLDNNGIVIRLTKDIFNSNSEPERALDPDNYDWSKFTLVLDNSNMTLEQKNNAILTFLQNQGILPL